MNRRFLAATILALAVLFSQGGGLVLAAICPHLRAQHGASCHENTHENSTGYHQMGHEMAPAGDAEVFESEEAAVSCNHCAIHSRTKRDDSALQSTNTLQRESDPPVLTSFHVVEPESLLKAPAWSPKAHGPPLDTGPLHLLHNVFRI